MRPLIEDRQKVTVLYDFYKCNPIVRGDIILLVAGGKVYIKVIKALPKDRFLIEKLWHGYALRINGELAVTSLGDPYVLPEAKIRMLQLYEKDYNGIIPPNSYLVLGNDPQGTHDSTLYGLVTSSNIIGKVIP